MTKTLLVLLSVALLLAFAVPAAAQEEDDDGVTTEITLGGRGADADGNPNLVSEYEPNEGGAEVGVTVTADRPWGHLFLDALYLDETDQDGRLIWDWHRRVRSDTTWTKLPHRLLHDRLGNLAAATNHGRIVEHTDLDPDSIYGIRYSRLEHRTEFQPTDRLVLSFEARNQEREGQRQLLTASHCASCHVIAQDRPIDERNTDVGGVAEYRFDRATFRASYTYRELEQDPTFLTLLFDDALQPELQIPIFDNRLSWDSAQGPQPVDALPDIEKQTLRLDFAAPQWGGVQLHASGVWSETENQFTGLSSEYQGIVASLGKALKGGWNLRWRGHAYTIDNDPVFVDIVEPASIAGPHRGRTYRDVYGFDPDFLRLSSLDRDVIDSRLDASYKLGGRQAGRLRLTWELEVVDRQFFEVAPEEMETTTNVLGVGWRGRPARRLKLEARLRHGEVDNPFTNVDGVFSINTSERVTSPFAPNADQYFDFQDGRIGDASGSPESFDELTLGLTHTGADRLFTARYRWWDGDNDEGDLADWSRTVQAATFSYWVTPAPDWEWFVAYARHESELSNPASVALFDG